MLCESLILFINFMIKKTDRTPLSKLDIYEQIASSPKRKIKISGQKLPADFFNLKNNSYSSMVMKPNQAPKTSSFQRKIFKEDRV